jgi:hypothetical protein
VVVAAGSVLVASMLCLFAAPAVVAVTGLDPALCTGGIAMTPLDGANGAFPALSSKIARSLNLAVGRLLPDGRLDRCVSNGGWILDRVPRAAEVGLSTASPDPLG